MLEDVIRQLDEELYLDSEYFEQEYAAIQNSFLSSPVRKAAHAGGAYEGDPEKLKQVLDGLFDGIDVDINLENAEKKQVSLLISPHIDLHRGGPGFAHAYAQIQNSETADLYVILGTGHHSHSQYMTLTKKDFETPLGVLKTDIDFVDAFSCRVGLDVFEEEFIHRDEHSIEFQVLFLQHVLGPEWQGKIVPILCGSFHEFIHDGVSPREDEGLLEALNVLRDMMDEYDGKVTVIAGVDMSHVGRRFGHEEGAPIQVLERIKQEDQDVLDALVTGDAESFYRRIEAVKDKNNVCGLTPVYMSLACVQPKDGSVLFYDQAVEGDYESIVSFASAVFYRK
jgi:AmmeMemoRadiSam system protein B